MEIKTKGIVSTRENGEAEEEEEKASSSRISSILALP